METAVLAGITRLQEAPSHCPRRRPCVVLPDLLLCSGLELGELSGPFPAEA